MENHPLYKKLSRMVLEENYTVEQVRNLDYGQAAELLDTRSFSDTFLNNMKRGVVLDMQNRGDKNSLHQLKQTATDWLDTNFTNWEAEIERENGTPCVNIWLEGKP